jgi:DNA-3-methyladenine glycosylase I
VARLLLDPGIVRHRRKVAGAVTNARAFLAVQSAFGSFDAYLWRFVDGVPRVNAWRTHGEIPARTAESDALSKDLERRGFTFVGPTICYAYMQAVGLVDDHLVSCFRHGAGS